MTYFIKAPLQVSLSHYRAGTEIFLSGMFEAATKAVCSRCAEEFDLPSHRRFRYVLAPKAINDGDDVALKAELVGVDLHGICRNRHRDPECWQ